MTGKRDGLDSDRRKSSWSVEGDFARKANFLHNLFVFRVQVKKSHVSRMLPENFSERSIRVFSKRRDDASVGVARKAFVVWAEGRGLSAPIASGDTLGVDMNDSVCDGE